MSEPKVVHIIEQGLNDLKKAAPETAAVVDQIVLLIRPLEQQYNDQLEIQSKEVTKQYTAKTELNDEKGALINTLRSLLLQIRNCPYCRNNFEQKTVEDANALLAMMSDPALRRQLGKVTGI